MSFSNVGVDHNLEDDGDDDDTRVGPSLWMLLVGVMEVGVVTTGGEEECLPPLNNKLYGIKASEYANWLVAINAQKASGTINLIIAAIELHKANPSPPL